ncbi:MAG: cupin domain-containing protein [Brumimicrobium sp.]|nr:cupin domain-containing protein [Brumimicrobium sp.]
MKIFGFFASLLFLIFHFTSLGQDLKNIKEKLPDAEYENILVVKLDGDERCTQFLIWVKDTVRTHKHAVHSESIYVLEGEGIFYFNNEVKKIREGDFVFIPANTWHSVKVTSEVPLKVLSNQSPEFKGEDRIFPDE